jgi:peptidoglycan hydrolase CwlO-like protein
MNNGKSFRLSWEAIGIIIAIMISIIGVAFSLGSKSSQISSLQRDVRELKNMKETIQILDKNVVKIQTQLRFLEPSLQRIDERLTKLNEKVDNLAISRSADGN